MIDIGMQCLQVSFMKAVNYKSMATRGLWEFVRSCYGHTNSIAFFAVLVDRSGVSKSSTEICGIEQTRVITEGD